MSYKITTALIAATTLAFAAPAFANSPSPADEVIQTGTTTVEQSAVIVEPVIEIEPVVKTESIRPSTDAASFSDAADTKQRSRGRSYYERDLYCGAPGSCATSGA